MRLATDLLDEGVDEIGRGGAEAMQGRAALAAELGDEFPRVEIQPGNDLSAIATRGSPARRLCFGNGDLDARLGEMQRRRQSAEPTADDRDLGGEIGGQRRCVGQRDAGLGPKTSRGQVAHFHDLTRSACGRMLPTPDPANR